MQQTPMSLVEWQQRFSTEEACEDHLFQMRWPDGFICPGCDSTHHYFIGGYNLYECADCGKRTSVTAGTLFHATKVPLVKWFTALYFVGVDKGGISAERLSQYLAVSWPTASLMLRKLRHAMGQRDAGYVLTDLVELDTAYMGGRDTGGKRGKGSSTKTAVLVACEASRDGEHARHLKMQVIGSENTREAKAVCEAGVSEDVALKTDGSPALKALGDQYDVTSKVCSGPSSKEWLRWVHLAISNAKRFLLGTYHGVSPDRLQSYLDEYCYRFNRRGWLLQIPERLLNCALSTAPIRRSAFLL
jgi:transposase-like protein